MRYRAKKDKTHAGIVAALRVAGCSVLELHAVGKGCPDALVGRNGVDYLLEIKTPGAMKRAGWNATRVAQDEFAAAWRGRQVQRVESIAEALRAVGSVL